MIVVLFCFDGETMNECFMFHILETDFVESSEMIHLNVITLTQLTRLFLPNMIQNKRGGILNIGSIAGEVAGRNQHIKSESENG